MSKISRASLLVGTAFAVNLCVGLLLRYTSFGDRMPVSVQIGLPVFTFVVGSWFLLTHAMGVRK